MPLRQKLFIQTSVSQYKFWRERKLWTYLEETLRPQYTLTTFTRSWTQNEEKKKKRKTTESQCPPFSSCFYSGQTQWVAYHHMPNSHNAPSRLQWFLGKKNHSRIPRLPHPCSKIIRVPCSVYTVVSPLSLSLSLLSGSVASSPTPFFCFVLHLAAGWAHLAQAHIS